MKQEWGRKSYGWPSRKPAWTMTALVVSIIAIPLAMWFRVETQWSPLQRFYWPQYYRAAVTSSMSNRVSTKYQLLEYVDRKGKHWTANDDVLIAGNTIVDGYEVPFALSPDAEKQGAVKLSLVTGKFNSARIYSYLGHWIYGDQTITALARPALLCCLGLFGGLLLIAIPKDIARANVRRHGRRLRGPELVTAATFNQRNRSDGIGFPNLERPGLLERTFCRDSHFVHIPREREAMHLLVMGDSGTGKSSLIRGLLAQIEQRGESAIVYDPAGEYAPQFFSPKRGDVILNPLDRRAPYWTPGDEVEHEAEALTIAASLFPDNHKENPFFIEGPRKVFAHLLTLRPSPEELVYWLCHEEELDRRLKGTELAMMIYPSAAAQRAGVLASLNMVADSFKMLPSKGEPTSRWSAAQWSKRRQGWIFLTSTPNYRKRLLPLTSLWLDLLVLRLMNQGFVERTARKTWFILDELASLQRLPQLHTAVTENRKSNCPVVLGFQGRAQLETRYGHDAEAMLSQPATKIFLRTTEPESAKWISASIGEIEVERMRESRSHGEFPHMRHTHADMLEHHIEPLVMPSEIQGLENLHGYFKSGNLVVRMQFPYIDLPARHDAFLPRPTTDKAKMTAAVVTMPPPTPTTSAARINETQQQGQAMTASGELPFFE